MLAATVVLPVVGLGLEADLATELNSRHRTSLNPLLPISSLLEA